MLDIPVRVKDALRDGRLLKNYKIKYIKDVPVPEYSQIGVVNSSGFTIPETAEYMVGNGGLYNEFWLTYTIDGHTDTYFIDGEEESIWQAGTVLSTVSDQKISIKRYVPTPTEFTIDNNQLIDESVKINERLCSGDVLSFGLCEGSSIEFEYFDEIDLLGYEINVNLDVQYYDDNGDLAWYSDLPMGHFTIVKCARQASTGIYKVTAYNKLMSDYLDAKANNLIKEIPPEGLTSNLITLQSLQDYLLQDYEIIPEEPGEIKTTVGGWNYNNIDEDVTVKKVDPEDNDNYHLGYDRKTYTIDLSGLPIKRIRLIHKLYTEKVNRAISEIKENIYQKVRDPDVAWTQLMESEMFWNTTRFSVEFINNSSYTPQYYSSSLNPHRHALNNAIGDDVEFLYNDLGFRYIRAQLPTKVNFVYQQTSAGLIWESADSYSDVDFVVKALQSDDIQSILIDKNTLPEVTLRDLIGSNYELHCQYGQLDRQTDLFTGIELNKSALYPADTLYPAADLYPGGTRERTVKSGYSKLWSESGNVQSWRYLIITYKGLDSNNQEVEKTLQMTINANGTTDYNMSDNWLFKNLVWSDNDVEDYADAMVSKMQDVTWFPFEMWGAGLPYLETGDQIEVVDNTGETYTSYVLSRQLDGIQNLQDTLMNGTLDIF